jgi:GT2 family glycosyltransferase
MKPSPLVAISLVTFNGMRWLEGCLRSLEAQDLADYELLIVDNASADGTLELLRDHAASDGRVMVESSPENLGYAKAHNRNIARARGDFICLLNQDIELDAGFLRESVAAFGLDRRIGSVQGRLRRLDPHGKRTDVLDTTGLQMQRDRRVVSRGQGEHDGEAYAAAGPVFGADGPAPVYRCSALVDARLSSSSGGWEVLDEDFFMYKEDVDLAWRLRLLGWKAWYAPDALAWHARGAGGPRAVTLLDIARTNWSLPGWVKQLSWRNQRLMQVKNEEIGAYLADLPWIIRRELLSLAFILLADPLRLRVVPSLLRALPSAMRKRQSLQRRIRGRRRQTL